MKKEFESADEFWEFINAEKRILPLGKLWVENNKIMFADGLKNAKEAIYGYYHTILENETLDK